jgi:hypothetical protein
MLMPCISAVEKRQYLDVLVILDEEESGRSMPRAHRLVECIIVLNDATGIRRQVNIKARILHNQLLASDIHACQSNMSVGHSLQ